MHFSRVWQKISRFRVLVFKKIENIKLKMRFPLKTNPVKLKMAKNSKICKKSGCFDSIFEENPMILPLSMIFSSRKKLYFSRKFDENSGKKGLMINIKLFEMLKR